MVTNSYMHSDFFISELSAVSEGDRLCKIVSTNSRGKVTAAVNTVFQDM